MADPPARFETFRSKAERLVESPGRVQKLLRQSTAKLAGSGGDRVATFRDQVRLAIDLVRAWLSGEYRSISNRTLVVVVAALLYFVVPMDLIPDFLLGWGYLDDMAVLGYVFTQVREELHAFARWRESQNSAVGESDPGDHAA